MTQEMTTDPDAPIVDWRKTEHRALSVLVRRRDADEKTAGGIFLAPTTKEEEELRKNVGTVLAVPEALKAHIEAKGMSGMLLTPEDLVGMLNLRDIKVGDRITYQGHAKEGAPIYCRRGTKPGLEEILEVGLRDITGVLKENHE